MNHNAPSLPKNSIERRLRDQWSAERAAVSTAYQGRAMPIAPATMRAAYVPTELADSIRDGAMHAYRLPSVIGGRLVPSPYAARQARIQGAGHE